MVTSVGDTRLLLQDHLLALYSKNSRVRPNGERYPLVGGTRERHCNGIHSKPRKTPENAQTPTSRVHAVLGAVGFNEPIYRKLAPTPVSG